MIEDYFDMYLVDISLHGRYNIAKECKSGNFTVLALGTVYWEIDGVTIIFVSNFVVVCLH